MSNNFEHLLVSQLHKPNNSDLHEQSNDFPWKLDGIPVRRELYDLGNEMRRSFAGYRFHAARVDGNKIIRITYRDGIEKNCYGDVMVYIDGSDYVVGRIGYGKSYGVTQSETPTYMINSRKIENDKFAEHRVQYNMSFVKDLKRALKLALTKLTPYSAKEMAGVTLLDFYSNLQNVRGRANTKLIKVIEPLQNQAVLLSELKGLMSQGVHFSTPEFHTAAQQVLQAEQEWEELRRKPMQGYYVYIRMVGDAQWADVVDVTDIGNRNLDAYPYTSFPAQDLPEDIQGKVAVLSMAQINQYMQGVGRRVSEKAFWIERG